MRTLRLASPILLAAALLGAPALGAADPAPKNFTLSAEFAPSQASPKLYTFKAEITDPETGQLMASPNVIAERGKSPKIQIGKEDLVFALEVSLDESGHTGSVTFTVTRDGKPIQRQKTTLRLK